MSDPLPPVTTLTPATPDELAAAVRAHPRVLAVGAGTKPRLAAVAPDVVRLSTARLSGIVDYEPSEFTFTALAGTPVRDIVATLAAQGQYLPFDPVFVAAGATLGGTVAAGLSGSGRWRFGSLRDFILGVKFVDGDGRLLRLGGKVVKNAAGFDVPKFFVGSAGRFGAFAELSFKVFPRPAATVTLRLDAPDPAAQVRILTEAARARWELDALDAPVGEPAVYVRLGGPPAALAPLAAEILARFPGVEKPATEAGVRWTAINEFAWAHPDGPLARFALTPTQVPAFTAFVRGLADTRAWLSAGGNVGYVSLPPGATFGPAPWPGLLLRGPGPLWLGPQSDFAIQRAVKHALDPHNRFPSLAD